MVPCAPSVPGGLQTLYYHPPYLIPNIIPNGILREEGTGRLAWSQVPLSQPLADFFWSNKIGWSTWIWFLNLQNGGPMKLVSMYCNVTYFTEDNTSSCFRYVFIACFYNTLGPSNYHSFAVALLNWNNREIDIRESISASIRVIIEGVS